MTDREYLRSLGFTVGERGRFSSEMQEALDKRKTDKFVNYVNDMREFLELPTRPEPVRNAQTLYGLTMGGARVAFVMCSSCADHMTWCECEKILAPDNVAALLGSAKDLAELHPRMVQLMTTH